MAPGWLEVVEFMTAYCPSEADQGLEPPDAEMAGCPLDVEGKFDPTGRPDDAEIADAPLRADLGVTPPVALDDAALAVLPADAEERYITPD